MFECDLKPYCNDDCDKCKYGKELKQRKEAAEILEELKATLVVPVQKLLDLLEKRLEKRGKKNG